MSCVAGVDGASRGAGRLADPVGTLSRAGRRPCDAPGPPRAASERPGRTQVNRRGAPPNDEPTTTSPCAPVIDCRPIQPLQTPRPFRNALLDAEFVEEVEPDLAARPEG